MAQPPLSAVDRVSAAIDELMTLEASMRLGHPSQRAVHEHEEELTRIAGNLRGIYRRQERPVNPPLGRVGSAYVW